MQKYLKKPALHNNHKYDFRIYVLLTSVISPMNIFIYNDGLVRLASEQYSANANFDDPYIHLTNYSLNKNSSSFDQGKHKLRLSDVLKGELTSECKGKTYRRSARDLNHEIEQIVIKTIFTVQPQLQHLYRTSQAKEPDIVCDLLGFDVMLDSKLKPWILEVNHLPSFRADTKLDADVKHDLIKNTLQIMQLGVEYRRQLEVVLRKEKAQAMIDSGVRRMTAKEHSLRVRFDIKLIESLVPNNRFKRIYPLDAGQYAPGLEEFYMQLEKFSNRTWRKQAGMVQKKKVNPHYADGERPKRKKARKGVLTSMTSHIKVKDTEQEEDPEDGELSDVPEPEQLKKAELPNKHNYVIANKIAAGQMPRRALNQSSQGSRGVFNQSMTQQ